MQVTPIGWILLVAGPLLALLRPRWLYIATIFFLPFTATDLINVGTGVNASGLQASMYLGSLLILRSAAGYVSRGALPLPRSGRASALWLGLFTVTVGLSLVMPMMISGHVQVPASRLGDLSSTPLYLSSHNITSALYVLYGFLLTYLVAIMNRSSQMLWLTLKTFLSAAVFAAAWGLLQLVCNVTGIKYPAMVFNTGTSLAAMGYGETLTGSISRLSSVSVEPSIFAQTLLVALSLYFPFVFGTRTLFGKTKDRLFFCLLASVLCLTTSSTAYVGIIVMVLMVLLFLAIRGVLKPRHLAIPLAGMGAFALLYVWSPVVEQVLNNVLFAKSEGYSSLERLMTATNAFAMFREFPMLGIGWGSVVSHDLIANILGNAGIVGLALFSAAMYNMFQSLYRSIARNNRKLRVPELMQIDFALYVALAVMLITCVLSGFVYMFGFFWFICGLAIAASDHRAAASNVPRLMDRMPGMRQVFHSRP